MGRGGGKAGRAGREAWGLDKKGGEDSLDSTKVSSLTAFSQMPTARHDSTGRLETGATIRTAASNIMSSKSTPSDLQAHQNRSRRALALARKLAMAPGRKVANK
jgi:hypothetical protein